MKRRLVKTGGGYSLQLEPAIVELVGIDPDLDVELITDGRRLIVSQGAAPTSSPRSAAAPLEGDGERAWIRTKNIERDFPDAFRRRFDQLQSVVEEAFRGSPARVERERGSLSVIGDAEIRILKLCALGTPRAPQIGFGPRAEGSTAWSPVELPDRVKIMGKPFDLSIRAWNDADLEADLRSVAEATRRHLESEIVGQR